MKLLVGLLAACGGASGADGRGDAGSQDAGAVDAGATVDAHVSTDASVAPTGPLGLADVSILLPLPSRVGSPHTLRLDDVGVGGPLLQRSVYGAIVPFRDPGDADASLRYESFRVVGLRIDPCFPDLAALRKAPASCRRQIRLVAQPLQDKAETTGTTALDAAIHLLYDLDEPSFASLLRALVSWRGGSPLDRSARLGVHPLLAAEREGGPRTAALRAIVLGHAGTARLTQFTFMHGDRFNTWQFGGFLVTAAGLAPIVPHGVPVAAPPATLQTVSVGGGGVTLIEPATAISRALEPLFGRVACNVPGCSDWTFSGTPLERREALAKALEVEHPFRAHAENVDCASCHEAGPLRARAEALGLSADGLERFTSTWNLALPNTADDVGNPRRVRAFGYFDEQPVLSQRTINESAAVADALGAR